MPERPKIAFQVNCDNSEISKDGLFKIVNENKPGNYITDELFKQFNNTQTTIDQNFCNTGEIPSSDIIQKNFINEGSFAAVFNLPSFKIKNDNKEYVIRLTKNVEKPVDPEEYNGFLIQGFLANDCNYINPVKQIGIYSCGYNDIEYKTKKNDHLRDEVYENTTISGYGLYGILEKGKMDLKKYIKSQCNKKKKNDTLINAKIALKQLLIGIQHIHKKGFVHLDLKPKNIIIDMSNNIQIIDFGFATRAGTRNIHESIGTEFYQDEYLTNDDDINIHHDFKAISSIILGVNENSFDDADKPIQIIRKGLIDITETDSDKELLKTIGNMFKGHKEPNDTLINTAIEMLKNSNEKPKNAVAAASNKKEEHSSVKPKLYFPLSLLDSYPSEKQKKVSSQVSSQNKTLSGKSHNSPREIGLPFSLILSKRPPSSKKGGRRKTQRKRRTLRKNKKPSKSKKRRKNTLRRRRRSRR